MQRTKTITAVDIGTDKVSTLIAQVGASPDEIRIVGASSVPAKGMKKSQIVDLDEAISAITESLDTAERMAGFGVKTVLASVGGSHVQSQNSKGVVAIANPKGEISQEDVDRVIEAARAVSIPTAREIIHVIPREYKVDSQDGIKDPVGMSGVRLEAEAHLITGSSTAIKNIEKCLDESGVSTQAFVFSGLASSYAVLTDTERELGVVMLDIGSGSSSLCVYVDGALAHSTVLPIGARHISSDIALGLRISLNSAEAIKILLSKQGYITIPPAEGETRDQMRERKKREDQLNVDGLGLPDVFGALSRKNVVEGIIEPRLEEMFRIVGEELEKHHLFPLVPAGVVISGGGAETIGMMEMCKKMLELPARVARPLRLQGLSEEVDATGFSTAVGLLLYATHESFSNTQPSSPFEGVKFDFSIVTGVPKKIIQFIRSLLP